jgi:hypothetical protein
MVARLVSHVGIEPAQAAFSTTKFENVGNAHLPGARAPAADTLQQAGR